MIYLDGSRFFFDIEGCFSNLVEKAREENKDSIPDEKATELCKGFGKFFKLNSDYVTVGKDYKTVLSGIFSGAPKAVIPEFDVFFDEYVKAFGENEIFIVKKTSDMKIKAKTLADCANENGARAILITNPCCPTSLEMSAEDILNLCSLTAAVVVVDESFCVDENVSVLKNVPETDNLIVLKRMRFGGEPVFACGKNLPNYNCDIYAAEQAVGKVIFEHNSALKTAQRKLIDSRDSLYIRIKKLAIKYDSVERLFRSKGNCIFFKVKNADERAKSLYEMGVSVYGKDGYFCIFSGEKDENETVLNALEEVLK